MNFLLRRFGPERFLSLYSTCASATITEDCQRTLGVSLDELDKAFWTDVDQIVAREGPPDRWRLKRLKLGPKVDPVVWKTFLADYLAAADRLLAPYEHVRTTAQYQYTTTDNDGKAKTFSQTIRSVRSGVYRSLWTTSGDSEGAYLAHPGRSLEAHRKTPSDPWGIEDFSKRDSGRSYRQVCDTIDNLDSRTMGGPALLSAIGFLKNRVDPESVVVTAFERFIEEGRPRVRVRLENHSKYEDVPWRAMTFVLASDRLFALRSFELERLSDGRQTLQGEVDYDKHDGIPVLYASHSAGKSPDGKSTTQSLTILDRRFEPTAEDEFTTERLLTGPTVHKAVHSNSAFPESTAFAKWYWLPLLAGAASLVAGVAISLLRLLGRPPDRVKHGGLLSDGPEKQGTNL